MKTIKINMKLPSGLPVAYHVNTMVTGTLIARKLAAFGITDVTYTQVMLADAMGLRDFITYVRKLAGHDSAKAAV